MSSEIVLIGEDKIDVTKHRGGVKNSVAGTNLRFWTRSIFGNSTSGGFVCRDGSDGLDGLDGGTGVVALMRLG